jgi:hypothetical protein
MNSFYKISKILFELVLLGLMSKILSQPFNVEPEWNPFISWIDETSKLPYSPVSASTRILYNKKKCVKWSSMNWVEVTISSMFLSLRFIAYMFLGYEADNSKPENWHIFMLQVTAHVSCCKYTPASDLGSLWRENLNSFTEFLAAVQQGNTLFLIIKVEKAQLVS